MRRLRRLLSSRVTAAIVVPAICCLLLVQTVGLHLHTHGDPHGPVPFVAVHVTGAERHVFPGEELGEIQLGVDAVLNAQWLDDGALASVPIVHRFPPPALHRAPPRARELPLAKRAFGPSSTPPAQAPPA